MIAGRVQYIQLVDFAADRVKLSVEVLYGRGVGVLEASRKETRHDGGLAHFG